MWTNLNKSFTWQDKSKIKVGRRVGKAVSYLKSQQVNHREVNNLYRSALVNRNTNGAKKVKRERTSREGSQKPTMLRSPPSLGDRTADVVGDGEGGTADRWRWWGWGELHPADCYRPVTSASSPAHLSPVFPNEGFISLLRDTWGIRRVKDGFAN